MEQHDPKLWEPISTSDVDESTRNVGRRDSLDNAKSKLRD
jgi:hypothetical protein